MQTTQNNFLLSQRQRGRGKSMHVVQGKRGYACLLLPQLSALFLQRMYSSTVSDQSTSCSMSTVSVTVQTVSRSLSVTFATLQSPSLAFEARTFETWLFFHEFTSSVCVTSESPSGYCRCEHAKTTRLNSLLVRGQPFETDFIVETSRQFTWLSSQRRCCSLTEIEMCLYLIVARLSVGYFKAWCLSVHHTKQPATLHFDSVTSLKNFRWMVLYHLIRFCSYLLK